MPLKLLWATDGSEHAEEVLPFLEALLLPAAESITVLTVAPQAILSTGARPDPSRLLWGLAPSYREKVSELTTEIAVEATKRLAASPTPVDSMVRLGHPIDQIVSVARETNADLIALGSRGHSAFASLILGSVAFGVLVHAPCSVLVAKPGGVTPKRVLFATDGSTYAQRAEELLAALAKPPDAAVTVVSVVEPLVFPAGTQIDVHRAAAEALEEVRRQRQAEALECAEQTAGRLAAAGWRTDHLTIDARPADGILKAEQDIGADLIVIGSRGRTGSLAYVLGSVAQDVAHHSRAAVLIVKEKPSPS